MSESLASHIVLRSNMGYSSAAIAEMYGISVAAVENALLEAALAQDSQ